MTHGWTTEKTAAGFVWRTYRFEYGLGQTVLQTGTCSTRGMAMLRAKRWALYYRRGGV